MIKRPLLIFLLVVGALIFGAVTFIQSDQFAQVLKKYAMRYMPADFGIEGDFSGLGVRLIPPQMEILKPRITVKKRNILNLPEDTRVSAERVALKFRLFQIFSRAIRVNEVVISGGDIRLRLDPKILGKKQARRSILEGLHWDELLQIHAEAVTLEDTSVHVAVEGDAAVDSRFEVLAKTLRFGQWSGKGGVGYELAADLRDLGGEFPKAWKLPRRIGDVSARAHLNALGADVEEFVIKAAGLTVSASGSVSGNVLALQSLPVEANVSVDGDLSALCTYLPQLEIKKPDAKSVECSSGGRAEMKGKVTAWLDRPLETLKIEGTTEIRDARFREWQADQVRAKGAWHAATGEISVVEAVVTGAERPKQGGNQPGSGGRIELGAFKFRTGAAEKIRIPLTLDKVHFQWAAAPVLKVLYPLGFRATGPVELEFTPRRSASESWEILAKTDLRVTEFQLDNQKFHQHRPLVKIFSIPQIKVNGAIRIDSHAVRPEGVTLTLPHSKIFANGKVDFDAGFDLQASGNISLEDVETLAEQKIRGVGSVTADIHGPFSRVLVDFDPDLKDAEYVRLHLGHLKGRITFDEDPSHVILSDIQVQKGSTSYNGGGLIDLDKETLSLEVKVPGGDAKEVSHVFHELTAGLWWYPRTLTGPVHGSVKIGGGLATEKLQISGELKGTNLDFYGEKFRQAVMRGGYDRGRYYLDGFEAVKHGGKITGRITYIQPEDRFDWDFKTAGMTVSDLDHVERLDVPVRGKLAFESSGKGVFGTIDSVTQGRLTELSVRGGALPASEGVLRTRGGVATLQGLALGGQGALELVYDFSAGARSYLRGELRHLDFSPVLMLINSKLIQDPGLTGQVSGSVDLTFRSGEFEKASGKMDLSEYVLAKTGLRFGLVRPVSVRVGEGTFDIPDIALFGEEAEAHLTLHSRGGDLSGSIGGELALAIVEFFTPVIVQTHGASALDFSIGGRIKDPLISGEAVISGASLRTPVLETPFENISGILRLNQNTVTVHGVEADLANGKVNASGMVRVFADRWPKVALAVALNGNRLKIYPFQYAKVRGKLNVRGETVPYLIEGDVLVESALSRESFFNPGGGRALKTARYTPPPASTQQSDFPKFKLNVNASADSNIFWKNEILDGEGKGRFTIVNTLEIPRLVGDAELIQGKLTFKDRVFQIQSAAATFDNPTTINPRFNLTAVTDVNGNKIQMYVSGTVEHWKVDLSSTPVLSESEILSLLALGLSQDELRRLRQGGGTLDQGQAMSIVLDSLGFNRDVESKTGVKIDIDEAVKKTQEGTSAFRPSTPTEPGSSPKIVIRRKIGKKVDVSVGSTVGVGASSQREVNAELHVTPGFSIIGVWDREEGGSSQDRSSYGVDFKLQKRFGSSGK